jgi:hypothetical protein
VGGAGRGHGFKNKPRKLREAIANVMYMFNILVQDITMNLGKVVTNDVAEIQVILVPAFEVGVLVAEGGTS